MSSQVQNSSSCFTGLPQELTHALCKGLSPTDVDINRMAAALLLKLNQEATEDLKVWENAIESLHISVKPLPLKDRVGERSPQTRVKNLQDSIDGYYQHLNDAFLLYFNQAKSELDDLNEEEPDGKDEIKEGGISPAGSPPEELDQGVLSHAKYNEVLRTFIRSNKESEVGRYIFNEMLFRAVEDDKISLLKMLLDEGVEPIGDKEDNAEYDMSAYAWVVLLSFKAGFAENPDYCKLILNQSGGKKIDVQGLTYLLWLTCNSLTSPETEDQQLQVIKLLFEKGARSDLNLIEDYPPIKEEDLPLIFKSQKLEGKPQILAFLRSKQLID